MVELYIMVLAVHTIYNAVYESHHIWSLCMLKFKHCVLGPLRLPRGLQRSAYLRLQLTKLNKHLAEL